MNNNTVNNLVISAVQRQPNNNMALLAILIMISKLIQLLHASGKLSDLEIEIITE